MFKYYFPTNLFMYKDKKKKQEYQKKYREKNKEKLLKTTREWKRLHRERARELNRKSYKRNREKWSKWKKEFYQSHKEKYKERKILELYGEKGLNLYKQQKICQKCSSVKRLSIHHLDWDNTNNIKENLLLLCNSCHRKLHRFVRDSFPLEKKYILIKSQEWLHKNHRRRK